MTEKREPLLADRFLAASYHDSKYASICTKPFWESTRENLILAKRFVLSAEAARYCAELLAQNPRIIADAQDFAIPPFPRTYIELPYTEWYEIISGKKASPTADQRVGYLIVNNTVRGIAASHDLDTVGVSPIEYQLNDPWTLEEELEAAKLCGISRLQFDTFFWGESILKLGSLKCNEKDGHHINFDQWQSEGMRSLRANHSFKMALGPAMTQDSAEVFNKLYKGSAGDLRNIIGLLLFLNRTSKTRIERDVGVQPGRWIGRKQANFMSHRVISYSVNPTPKLIKLAAGESIRRRLHDVRGHLCHNEVARTNHHEHEWIESAEKDLQWYCECGGLRWWKKPHMRGTLGKGLVTSEYKVTD